MNCTLVVYVRGRSERDIVTCDSGGWACYQEVSAVAVVDVVGQVRWFSSSVESFRDGGCLKYQPFFFILQDKGWDLLWIELKTCSCNYFHNISNIHIKLEFIVVYWAFQKAAIFFISHSSRIKMIPAERFLETIVYINWIKYHKSHVKIRR